MLTQKEVLEKRIPEAVKYFDELLAFKRVTLTASGCPLRFQIPTSADGLVVSINGVGALRAAWQEYAMDAEDAFRKSLERGWRQIFERLEVLSSVRRTYPRRRGRRGPSPGNRRSYRG